MDLKKKKTTHGSLKTLLLGVEGKADGKLHFALSLDQRPEWGRADSEKRGKNQSDKGHRDSQVQNIEIVRQGRRILQHP